MPLSWVSSFFRRATVEIDTLVGAVPPQPVPDGAGGTEFFDTIYAKHGWQLTVRSDQIDVPVPAGVNPTDCWSSGALHNLMASVRDPATDIDADWRIHLVVVPARLGCSRRVMYDQIDVPRVGRASFSDDGYPSGDSANFGTAVNRRQREVARAYLRSATHGITHTFKPDPPGDQRRHLDHDHHPERGGRARGAGDRRTWGFPDQIDLAVNATVRHHLNHSPTRSSGPGAGPSRRGSGPACHKRPIATSSTRPSSNSP